MLEVTTTAWAMTIGLVLVLLAIDSALALTRPPEASANSARRRNLTRRAVAISLDVTESTIERWETSKVGIPDVRKLELARLLDVTPSQLMGWD